MLNKILSTINKYNLIQKGDKIVIGVSGGPDSMCLLDSLYCLKDKLNIEIIVAHINHKIRKEADEETEYVKDYCKNKNIKCYVKKAEVEKLAKEQKLGTEEMGRKIRYDFFKEVAKKEALPPLVEKGGVLTVKAESQVKRKSLLRNRPFFFSFFFF